MRTLPRAAQVYLLGIWSCALLIVPYAVLSAPPKTSDLLLIFLGIGLYAVADFFEVHFTIRNGHTIVMTLADAPTIFAVAILGMPGAFVVLFGSLCADLLHRRVWYRVLFNATARVLTYLLLVLVAKTLHPAADFIFDGFMGVVTMVAIAATLYIVNTLFISTIIAFATSRPLFQVYRGSFRMVHWVHFIIMPFGAILSTLWQANPWMLMIAVMPLIMSRRAFQAIADWQAESQRSKDLAHQAQHVSQRLERLQGVTTAMMTVSTSQGIVQTVSTQLATLLDASASWVVFSQQAEPQIALRHNVPPLLDIRADAFRPMLDQHGVQQLTRPDILALEPHSPATWQSLILIPLVHGDRIHGLVCLAREHETVLEPTECRVLMALAAQAALMIEHTNLFEELQQKQTELVRSSKLAALGTFAAGIAHEFNNLLAGILGYAELAEGSPDQAEQNYALGIIKQSCVRGRSITRSLLTFARRDTASRELHNLTEIVEDTLVLIERELTKQGIVIHREFAPVPRTLCDAGQISQVILNLLTNARDAMSEQGGGIITLAIAQNQGHVILKVSDTGAGIPEPLLDQVFQPFMTTKGALGGGKVAGTGLGLSICYGIIEEHHGTISIASRVGNGTTVTTSLPLVETEGATPTQRNLYALPALSMLLLDDDANVARSLARSLIGRGHSVSIAHSPAEALTLLKHTAFDVICCDVIMPDMDGLVFMQHLREHDTMTPVLVITGEPSSPLVDQMRELHPVALLQKPFTTDEMLSTLADISVYCLQ